MAYGLACVLFVVGAIEGGVRIRQARRFGDAFTVHVFSMDEQSGLRILKPGSVVSGANVSIHINSLGFRGPEIETPKPRDRVRIGFLGSSTTYCAEVGGDDRTWPHLVVKSLAARYPDSQFDGVNGAAPGWVVADSIKNLEHRVKIHEPDVLVIYEATNDLSKDTRALAKSRGLADDQAESASVFSRWSLAWSLFEKQLAVRRQARRAASGEARLLYDPGPLADAFGTRLEHLIDDSKAVAPLVVVLTFSHKYRREQSHDEQIRNASTSLLYMPYMSMDGLFAGFEAYNAAIRTVGRVESVGQKDEGKREGVLVVGGEYDIPGDDAHFVDSVHFSDRGAERMAERVFTALEGSDRFAALLAEKRAQTSSASGSRPE